MFSRNQILLGMVCLVCLLLVGTLPSFAADENDEENCTRFDRGDVDGNSFVSEEDFTMMSGVFSLTETFGTTSCSGPPVFSGLDANDNNDGDVQVITTADLLTLRRKILELSTPPPAMCDFDDGMPTSSIIGDGGLRLTLERLPFNGTDQEVVLSASLNSAGFVGGEPFELHGLSLALQVASDATAVDFICTVGTGPLEVDICVAPDDPGNSSDTLLLHLGDLVSLASIGTEPVQIGSFIVVSDAPIDTPLLPAPEGDSIGLPGPTMVNGRDWHTSVVTVMEDCFALPNDPPNPPTLPCFIDHIPVVELLVTAEPFIRGDSNHDGIVNIADGIFGLQSLFLDGDSPLCLDAADFDGDGAFTLGDATLIFSYQLLDGPPPAAPFPTCGEGLPGSSLGCASYSPDFCE